MNEKNQTWVSEIVLLGFQNLHNFKVPLFSLFLLIYILTVWENVLIIVLVAFSRNLHSPMYFFLQQLALTDLLEASNIVPTLLQTVIHDGATVSLVGCLTQMYFLGVLEVFECIFLAVMAYDRYVAICIPLRYTSIMSHRVCVYLTVLSWLLSLSSEIIFIHMIGSLQLCHQNTINHFFCDFFPFLELSCSDTFFIKMNAVLLCVFVILLPLILISVSYMCIAHAILKIVSHTGRQKAFSTCSSHLAVVSMFYGTLCSVYVVPPGNQSQTISKVLSLLYTVVTPLINPLIYCWRSTDMTESLKKHKDRITDYKNMGMKPFLIYLLHIRS
ncbi:olfactory receptor 5G3-like [Xenopus tropicalis]|uniref:Olfactory receptor n=1 Tax=Xenopus tropicalis TaxID=8364 RepID=A0A803JCM1_XENTR|nr:olfactory receptor 5G3-like [Xenopus tropicalis]|eukprot:XP_012809385.1 PREDICTED: olfactory receptor 5G3-like [Xenopus tropicalis]